MKIYASFLKPFIDCVLATFGFICLFPLFLTVSILLLWINRSNPFFFQSRPGKDGEIFKIIKFKSMTDEKDSQGNLLPESKRLTATGKFIRKYSIDEIPQLINVIKGDMSIIGPRPLLVSYLPLYNDFQKQRHLVKPGISGWAQINGRNSISWEQKFKYDVWYVNNLTFALDLKIIFLTIVKLLHPEGIYNHDEEFVTNFKGSEEPQNNNLKNQTNNKLSNNSKLDYR